MQLVLLNASASFYAPLPRQDWLSCRCSTYGSSDAFQETVSSRRLRSVHRGADQRLSLERLAAEGQKIVHGRFQLLPERVFYELRTPQRRPQRCLCSVGPGAGRRRRSLTPSAINYRPAVAGHFIRRRHPVNHRILRARSSESLDASKGDACFCLQRAA
jgi:hypothetical protein